MPEVEHAQVPEPQENQGPQPGPDAGASPGAAGAAAKTRKEELRRRAAASNYQAGKAALSPRSSPLSPEGAWAGLKDVASGAAAGLQSTIDEAREGLEGIADQVAGRWWDAQRDAVRTFRASGRKGPRNLQAPTHIGGFQAAYDPATGLQTIRIGAGVKFEDAMKLQGGRAVALHDRARPHAQRINALPAGDRAAAVARWQWTAAAKSAWLRTLESTVEGFWSRRFQFHVDRTYWGDVGAVPVVDVAAKAGAKGPDDHLSLTTWKVPDDVSLGVGVVNSRRGQPTGSSMTLGSSDVAGRAGNFLTGTIWFRPGAATVDAGSTAFLAAQPHRFKAGDKTPPKVRWRVQGDGADPKASSRSRYDAIKKVYTDAGFDEKRLSYAFGGRGTSASMRVGDGRAQVVAIHEFGHVLGLGDEYATDPGGGITGTGKVAGTRSRHDELARKAGLGGSVHENDDGLMSLGNAMRPSYGATFAWALRELTGLNWKAGPALAPLPPRSRAPRKDGAGPAGGKE